MEPKYIPRTHATTMGSTFINAAITPDNRLRELTYTVVLESTPTAIMAQVYRKSFGAPGLLSCDHHRWEESRGGWTFSHKDEQKFDQAPNPPPGAIKQMVGTFEVWTMKPLSPEEITKLEKLIYVLNPKT
jgi:hypothetical protein